MIALAFSNARRAVTDRKGVTAAEYAILAAGIVGAVAAGILLLGPALTAKLTGLVS